MDVEQRDPESDEREDVTIEPETGEDAVEKRPEDKIAKMREELGACRKEKQEYMDGWQRAKADYVNLLRRNEEAAKAAESSGKIKAVETLLPAFDALERAKEHGEVPEGFMAIAKQIESAFATLGLEEVGKVGEPFDPSLHEAFGQDVTENIETEDMITVVLEKGWRVNSTVIRPAKVRVAMFKTEA
ncbi:MAG: nucleotide exchange factor GrpE [Candidatus Paceibacterota bacterium]|jgi:molecular chaperone GrpE